MPGFIQGMHLEKGLYFRRKRFAFQSLRPLDQIDRTVKANDRGNAHIVLGPDHVDQVPTR